MNSIALVTVAISGFDHAVGTGSERTGQLSARAHRAWPIAPSASISSCSMPEWSQVRSACSLRRASRRLECNGLRGVLLGQSRRSRSHTS